MTAASFWGLYVVHCVQIMGLAMWARIRWVLNPHLNMCLHPLRSEFPLCFGSFELGLDYWGIMIPVCTIHVGVYEGIYVFYSLAMLSSYLSLTFSWSVLSLHWINPRLLLPLSFGLIKVKWVETHYLVTNHSITVFSLSFSMFYVQFISLTLFGCGGRVHVFHSPFTSLSSRGLASCKEQHGRMLRLHLCMLVKSPRGKATHLFDEIIY